MICKKSFTADKMNSTTKTRQQPSVPQKNTTPSTCTTKPVYEKKKPPKAQGKVNENRIKRIEESSDSFDDEQPTFWTVCVFCSVRYQYSRDYALNKVIHCQSCKKSFTAYELNAQGTTPAVPSTIQTRKQPSFPRQNRIRCTYTTKPVFEQKEPPKVQGNTNRKRKKRTEESSESSDSCESEFIICRYKKRNVCNKENINDIDIDNDDVATPSKSAEKRVENDTFRKVESKEITKDLRIMITNGLNSDLDFPKMPEILQGDNHEPATVQDSDETEALWQGNPVGQAAKEILEAVETCYPKTFLKVQIRFKRILLTTLKEFHEIIKGLLETSVDELKEEQITSLREDLKEFERSGFDLSWAHKRLDMVEKLKFGNEPLRQELMALEESLEPLQERLVEKQKQFVEARDMLEKAQLEYDNAKDARNSKAREVAEKFGDEYDLILKGQLGFGMLPGY